jgi:hypothetical protein
MLVCSTVDPKNCTLVDQSELCIALLVSRYLSSAFGLRNCHFLCNNIMMLHLLYKVLSLNSPQQDYGTRMETLGRVTILLPEIYPQSRSIIFAVEAPTKQLNLNKVVILQMAMTMHIHVAQYAQYMT